MKREKKNDSGGELESDPKPFTHRFGCKTNKAIRELYKDAIGHYILDPANQLHSNCDFREVLGKHSFLQ